MHKRNYTIRIALSIVMLAGSSVWTAPAGGGGGEPRNPANPVPFGQRQGYCPFPLRKGFAWEYAILKAGRKVGRLRVEVIRAKMETKRSLAAADGVRVHYFDVSFRDSYRKKRYVKKLLGAHGEIFIGRGGTYYPFMKTRVREGDIFGRMLVTEIRIRKVHGKKRPVMSLLHMDDGRREEYAQYLGLILYKKGDLEYRLVKANVRVRYEGCFSARDRSGKPIGP